MPKGGGCGRRRPGRCWDPRTGLWAGWWVRGLLATLFDDVTTVAVGHTLTVPGMVREAGDAVCVSELGAGWCVRVGDLWVVMVPQGWLWYDRR